MPTNLYGHGDNYHPSNSHVLPALISKFYKAKIEGLEEVVCWGTGSPKREFLFVDDLAEACIFVLENVSNKNKNLYDLNNNFNGILNIGTGLDISIKELALLIASNIEYKGKDNLGLIQTRWHSKEIIDISKLKNLGWTAKQL